MQLQLQAIKILLCVNSKHSCEIGAHQPSTALSKVLIHVAVISPTSIIDIIMLKGKSSINEKWRLRLNWFIVLFLVEILYKVSSIAYLTSFHRFVTNPRSLNQLNGTKSKVSNTCILDYTGDV